MNSGPETAEHRPRSTNGLESNLEVSMKVYDEVWSRSLPPLGDVWEKAAPLDSAASRDGVRSALLIRT